ncbi:MAG: glycosyltransferase [Ignavibacteria bacterium]|nr:glycosyltransferase [Ignavibacteria bacterium]
MKINILMVAYTNYSTDSRVIKESSALVERGMFVDFICLKDENLHSCSPLKGINIINIPLKRYRGKNKYLYVLYYLIFFLFVFLISSFLYIKKRYKIIHINNMPDFLVFAAIIPKLFGAKLILDIHDPLPLTFLTKFNLSKNNFFYKLLLLEERVSAKFVDKVITTHSFLRNEVLKTDGLPIEKIDVVMNLADEQRFKFLYNYNLNGKIHLVYYGTIAERFGLQYILELFYKFNIFNNFNIELTIIGSGDYETYLKNLIKRNKLESYVNFINKNIPYEELPKVLSNFNLGLVPYELSYATEYMLPVKLLELISLGIPVLVIKNKAISYYFTDEDVFFFNLTEPDVFIKLIKKIYDNKDLLYEKRRKLKEIRKKFFWSNEAVKYYNIIQNLVGVN